MSLQRLMLRTAIVRCLSNNETAPYPTIAEGRVFDTRIGEIQESENELLPFVSVYTDGDQRAQMASGDVRPIFKRSIDVVIEFGIGSWTRDEAGGDLVFTAPETDAELEAMLDLLEAQIWGALFHDDNAHAGAVQKLVKDWVGWDSIPGRSPKGTNKITARQLTISVRVTDDCFPDTRPNVAQSGISSSLPPYLSALVDAVATSPRLASLKRLVLGEAASETPVPEPVITFGVEVDFVDPVVDLSLLPEGSTQGPDGRIEIAAEWQTPEQAP